MRISRIKKVDGCLEGSSAKDIFFDKDIDKAFADHLGSLGKYIYNDSFDKPFFKIIVRGYYTLKGSVGNKSMRMIFAESALDDIMDELISHIENFSN